MTTESKAALEQAADALAAARAAADHEIKTCMAQIQADLPARAANAAKRVATQQPEVTKALGKDGIAELRAELQAVAESLGQQFVDATDEIKWPLGTSYTKVENHKVHSALFDRFYGHTGALSSVLAAKGYTLGDSDPFLPQSLYDQSKFTALSAALTDLGKATDNYEIAKKADNDSTVADLWGD
jgi:F0F1-type ATP synthase membrane subunit b/b'